MNSLDKIHLVGRAKTAKRFLFLLKVSLFFSILMSFDSENLREWLADSIICLSIFFGVICKLDMVSLLIFAGVKDLDEKLGKE